MSSIALSNRRDQFTAPGDEWGRFACVTSCNSQGLYGSWINDLEYQLPGRSEFWHVDCVALSTLVPVNSQAGYNSSYLEYKVLLWSGPLCEATLLRLSDCHNRMIGFRRVDNCEIWSHLGDLALQLDFHLRRLRYGYLSLHQYPTRREHPDIAPVLMDIQHCYSRLFPLTFVGTHT